MLKDKSKVSGTVSWENNQKIKVKGVFLACQEKKFMSYTFSSGVEEQGQTAHGGGLRPLRSEVPHRQAASPRPCGFGVRLCKLGVSKIKQPSIRASGKSVDESNLIAELWLLLL